MNSLFARLFTRTPNRLSRRREQALLRRTRHWVTPTVQDLEDRALLATFVATTGAQLYSDLNAVNADHHASDTILLEARSITLTQGQATVDPVGSLLIESTEGTSSSATVIHGGGFYVEGGGSTQMEYMTVTGGSGEDVYVYGTSTQATSLALNDVEITGANDGALTTRYTTLSATNGTEFLNCNSYGMITQGNVSIPGTGAAVQFVGNYTGWYALSDNFGGTISATGAVFTSNEVFGAEIYEGSATFTNCTFAGTGFRNISDYGTDVVTLNNNNFTGVTGSFGAIQTIQDNTSTFTVDGGSFTRNNVSVGLINTNGGSVTLEYLNLTGNTAPEMVSLGGVGDDTLTVVNINHNSGAGVLVTQAATEVFFNENIIENCTALAGQTAGAAVTLNGSDAFFVGGAYDYNTGGAIYDSGTDPDLTMLGTDMSFNTGAQGSLTVNIPSGSYGGSIMAQGVMFSHDQGTGSVSAVNLTGAGSVSSLVVQQGSFLDDTNGYSVSIQLSGQGGEMVAVDQELFQGDNGAVKVTGPTGQLFGPAPQFVFGANEVTGNNNALGQVYLSGLGSFVVGGSYIHGNIGDGVTIVGNSSYSGTPGTSVLVVGNTITGNSNPKGNGGGISATDGFYDAQEFVNNTIYGNSAVKGGGIYDQGLAPSGQGNFSAMPGVNIVEDTITQNTATGSGGGIWFAAAPGWPFGPPPPTMVGAPGALSLDSSIVAQNNGPSSSPDIAGTVFAAVYSLVGNDSGATFSNSTANDILGTAGSPVNAGLYGPVTLPGGPGVSGSGSVGSVFEPGSVSVSTGDASLDTNPYYGIQTSIDELGNTRSSYPATQGAVVTPVAPTKPKNPINPVKPVAPSLLVTVSSPTPVSQPVIGGVLLTTGSPTTVRLIGLTNSSSSPKTATVVTKSVAVPAGPVSFQSARVVNQGGLLSPAIKFSF